jgi:hypothetical protein
MDRRSLAGSKQLIEWTYAEGVITMGSVNRRLKMWIQ